jgi:hypothetical protein
VDFAREQKEGGFSIQNSLIVDQAAINAGFDFRRYTTELTPHEARALSPPI